LTEIKSTEGDGVVYVRADRKIAYGDVMELLGKVGDSGFSHVSLLSQPSPSAANTATN
jgi:biopolymer transport protein TolR